MMPAYSGIRVPNHNEFKEYFFSHPSQNPGCWGFFFLAWCCYLCRSTLRNKNGERCYQNYLPSISQGLNYFVQKETSLGIKWVMAQFHSVKPIAGNKENTLMKYPASKAVEQPWTDKSQLNGLLGLLITTTLDANSQTTKPPVNMV